MADQTPPDELPLDERLAEVVARRAPTSDPAGDAAYWQAREAEERERAAEASCMARTAHEDLADDYADKVKQAQGSQF